MCACLQNRRVFGVEAAVLKSHKMLNGPGGCANRAHKNSRTGARYASQNLPNGSRTLRALTDTLLLLPLLRNCLPSDGGRLGNLHTVCRNQAGRDLPLDATLEAQQTNGADARRGAHALGDTAPRRAHSRRSRRPAPAPMSAHRAARRRLSRLRRRRLDLRRRSLRPRARRRPCRRRRRLRRRRPCRRPARRPRVARHLIPTPHRRTHRRRRLRPSIGSSFGVCVCVCKRLMPIVVHWRWLLQTASRVLALRCRSLAAHHRLVGQGLWNGVLEKLHVL